MNRTRTGLNIVVASVTALGLSAAAFGAPQTKEVAGTLNELIEHTRDGQEGYQLAADKVGNPQLKKLFGEYSKQRGDYASSLQAEVAKLGVQPETSPSTAGAAHRGWINLKAALTQDDKAILTEVIRGDETALQSYNSALSKLLPEDIRKTVAKQRDEISEDLQKIRLQATQQG